FWDPRVMRENSSAADNAPTLKPSLTMKMMLRGFLPLAAARAGCTITPPGRMAAAAPNAPKRNESRRLIPDERFFFVLPAIYITFLEKTLRNFVDSVYPIWREKRHAHDRRAEYCNEMPLFRN